MMKLLGIYSSYSYATENKALKQDQKIKEQN